MRRCNNSACKRETEDAHETTCIVCGWMTVAAVREAPKAEEKRVNLSRHRE